MTNHSDIVEQYLKAQFSAASVVRIPDPEWQGFWAQSWRIEDKGTVMRLRVSKEFLEESEQEVRALLKHPLVTMLRESAGRIVLLSRDGIRYLPEKSA